MRCPKCHYISFGSAERCRNCGYEFLLAVETPPPVDLPIQSDDERAGPLADFVLAERAPAPLPTSVLSELTSPALPVLVPVLVRAQDWQRARAWPPSVRRPGRRVSTSPCSAVKRVTTRRSSLRPRFRERRCRCAGASPRPPGREPIARSHPMSRSRDRPASCASGIAVRRRRSLRAACRSTPRSPTSSSRRQSLPACSPVVSTSSCWLPIDAAVLYFTLLVVELPPAEIRSLPGVPLGVFLLLLNGGYLALFTIAGGQTIGKMLTRIKVVADRPAADPEANGQGLA